MRSAMTRPLLINTRTIRRSRMRSRNSKRSLEWTRQLLKSRQRARARVRKMTRAKAEVKVTREKAKAVVKEKPRAVLLKWVKTTQIQTGGTNLVTTRRLNGPMMVAVPGPRKTLKWRILGMVTMIWICLLLGKRHWKNNLLMLSTHLTLLLGKFRTSTLTTILGSILVLVVVCLLLLELGLQHPFSPLLKVVAITVARPSRRQLRSRRLLHRIHLYQNS